MDIRNVAIIAHVDHGKTTLVDALLRQSDSFHTRNEQASLIMDSNELERERGITIFSKNASVQYGDTKINIIDTPGHADFGGEVERIMTMASGVLLLVDAKDGPMPQTKFVLRKALERGHKVVVVINKIDVPHARVQWVLDKTFDLFIDLGASDEQADFPVLYASAVQGKAGFDPDLSVMEDIAPVFDTIVSYLPAPVVERGPMQMSVVSVAYDSYLGQIAIGPLVAGSFKKGQTVARMQSDGTVSPATIASVMTFDGLGRTEVPHADAGDIVAVAGIEPVIIGETIADPDDPRQLPVLAIDEPTVTMRFSVNTSPLAGTEGEYSTSRHLSARLLREALSDVALRVEQSSAGDSSFDVFGRGELHLSILIEKMAREGYEFQVGKPQVILKEMDGRSHEPFEDVYIECPETYSGTVIEHMGKRKGEMVDMNVTNGSATMHFLVSTRGLIGYRSEFIAATRGEGTMSTLFHGYAPYIGDIDVQPHGSLVAHEDGVSTHYGIAAAQARGTMFIQPGEQVYEGMIVGRNARAEDIDVNVCREKKLTNMRASGSDSVEVLHASDALRLEEAIEYLGDDELLEVTPLHMRLRKAYLTKRDRKRVKHSVAAG